MKPRPSARISIFSVLTDLLLYLAFIVIGVLIYYHFLVSPVFYAQAGVTVTISPILTDPVGGINNAVYLMSGIPTLIGLIGLFQLVFRLFSGLALAARKT